MKRRSKKPPIPGKKTFDDKKETKTIARIKIVPSGEKEIYQAAGPTE